MRKYLASLTALALLCGSVCIGVLSNAAPAYACSGNCGNSPPPPDKKG